jgi:S-adenosylmethionine:tRNA ribosyltransferase-isomerase
VEVLLLRREASQTWEALVGGKGITRGKRLQIDGGPAAEVLSDLGSSRRLIRFEEPISPRLAALGEMPLPPYIHARLEDSEDYQTVFAREPGSAAAPTAGLHFTPALLEGILAGGTRIVRLTLHIGLDTFAPVTEADASRHVIHSEWCRLGREAAGALNTVRREGGRIIAVGTTVARTLESAARKTGLGESVVPYEGPTDLFILPGHRFRAVDAMVTNFHLPRSTLLMLVSAFAGRERVLHAYEIAKEAGYRFYSFGDAMLIL